VRCLANEMVKFGYDGCAESWTVEGTDSKLFATVRGWVGSNGSSYRCGELHVDKEQAVGFEYVANAPRKGRRGAKGRERWGGDRTDENG